jgi:hypothetical protein
LRLQLAHEWRREQNLHLLFGEQLGNPGRPPTTVIFVGRFAGFCPIRIASVWPDVDHLSRILANFSMKESAKTRILQADIDIVAEAPLQLADAARPASERIRAQLVYHLCPFMIVSGLLLVE